MYLFAALALALAVGVSGQAQAADLINHSLKPSVKVFEHWTPNGNPDTAAALPGPTTWAAPIAVCFAPNAPCSSDPVGGVNMGYAISYWPISGTGTGTTCTNVSKQECGSIVGFSESTTASGALSAKITFKQGTKTVGTITITNADLGGATVAAGNVVAIQSGGFKLKSTAKAVATTITFATKIGTSTATSKATVYLD
jgi:hypothetical protein